MRPPQATIDISAHQRYANFLFTPVIQRIQKTKVCKQNLNVPMSNVTDFILETFLYNLSVIRISHRHIHRPDYNLNFSLENISWLGLIPPLRPNHGPHTRGSGNPHEELCFLRTDCMSCKNASDFCSREKWKEAEQ